MKQKDVKVGETYLTRIGAELCPVVIIHETTNYKGKTAFRVARVGEDTWLPKVRSAAALRPLDW